MISAERAAVIERELASLCGVEPDELRDYLRGYVKSGRARRTGFTFVRGTHGGTYVLDPEGVDELPAGNAIRPNVMKEGLPGARDNGRLETQSETQRRSP